MTPSAEDIERIVREVLRSLGGAVPDGPAAPAPPAAAPAPVPAAPAVAPPSAETGKLMLNGRVITMDALSGRLANVRQVTVLPGALVTPAVRDELFRRNVALVVAADGAPRLAPGSLRVVLVAARTKFKPAPLAKALEAEGLLVVPHELDCLMAAADLVAHQVGQGKTLALLLTRHTASALCLANRLAKVRAVLAVDPLSLPAVAEGIGANVMVANPDALGLHSIKRMALDFCRDGVRPCPAVFQQRLG